jgi:ElaB/YqjD/DUF883 family membrane-anchored ribosome-binding protein
MGSGLLPINAPVVRCDSGRGKKGFFMDVPRTREEAKDHLEAITDQISDGLERGRYTLNQLQEALVSRTKQAAATTDELVHDNPWGAIGVGVALGLLIGFMLPRR